MMEAFFFGPSNQQLFGSYHPPLNGDGYVLTVICPPLFSELGRTHSALRRLALSLAERGQHVLRFDYRGTGDSFGDLEAVNVSDWIADVELAVEEGRDVSGCEKVQVLAVRAGGLLACTAAGAASDIHKVVLWDPVADGVSYLQSICDVQAENFKHNFRLSRAERSDAMRDIGGWRISEPMREQFGSLGADAYARVPSSKLHVVSTASENGFSPAEVAAEVLPYPCNWESNGENLINPQPVLERLFACLTKS